MENGGTRNRIDNISSFEEFCKQKKGVIVINNQHDNLCLARSLVVAIAYNKKEDSEEARKNYKLTCDSQRNYQLQEARQLRLDARVNLNNGGGCRRTTIISSILI